MRSAQPVLPGRQLLFLGLLLCIFGIAFEMIGVATALPTVMADLGALPLYAWAFSTMVTGMLTATMICGRLADRSGPLLPMVAGYLLFAVGLLVGALAPNVATLLLARFIQGLGAGALNLAFFVVIAFVYRPEERPGVLAWVSFTWVLPAFVGPPIAAALTELSWRWVFAAMLPLLAVAGLLVLPALRRLPAVERHDDLGRFSGWAVAAVAIAPFGVQLAGQGLGVWSVLAGLVAVGGLVLGLPRVLPATVSLFGPRLGAVVLTRAIQAGAFFAAEAFLLLALQKLRGLGIWEAGLSLTIGSLGWSLGSWLQSRPWLRLRRDQMISLGSALTTAGILAITAFVAWPGTQLALGILGWTTAGLGMGLMMASTAVATMSLSSDAEQGRNNSALQLAEGLGNALLTGLAGALYAVGLRVADESTAFLPVFVALSALCAVALLSGRRIGELAG